jgi:phospholipid/cholesterol/gamma-HCH transport system permease protein
MAAVPRALRPLRSTGRAAGDLLEDIGKQLRFYAQVLYEIVSQVILRLKYRNVVFNLVSDITIGAGALIVGGGMIFVIFSMSFFTGTEVGLQGFKGLEQIGAENFTGLVGAFANTREVTPLIAGVAFAARWARASPQSSGPCASPRRSTPSRSCPSRRRRTWWPPGSWPPCSPSSRST